MTGRSKGPRRRPARSGTRGQARPSEIPDVEDLAKAIADALSHQASTSNMADFAGAVVHNAFGQASTPEEKAVHGRSGNRLKKWNEDHPPRWGAWVAACLIAVAPIFIPAQSAQSQPQPQAVQSESDVPFATNVTISVVTAGPPNPITASGGGPKPGSSDTEFVNVNLDLSAVARFMPSEPHALRQQQINSIAGEMAAEILQQLAEKQLGESVPTRIQVGEMVYEFPPFREDANPFQLEF